MLTFILWDVLETFIEHFTEIEGIEHIPKTSTDLCHCEHVEILKETDPSISKEPSKEPIRIHFRLR